MQGKDEGVLQKKTQKRKRQDKGEEEKAKDHNNNMERIEKVVFYYTDIIFCIFTSSYIVG